MSRKKTFQPPDLTVSELSRALYETSLRLDEANIQLSKANQDLQKANEQLLQDQQTRQHFYANVSHDLRAPITAICNFNEYLLTQFATDVEGRHQLSMDPEELYHILNMISQRTDHLSYLINNIFLLSSLEFSDQRVKLEPVHVGFFLEDYFYMCQADRSYEHAQLQLDIPEDFDYVMNLDPRLMHSVLDNLFTNAMKYSPEPPRITLGAYIKKAADTDASLVIYVEDQGIGIAEEDIPRIFDLSYRVDSARTPGKTTGNGFGLAIVKKIVKHHHGDIRCDSKLGQGSRFTLSFPISVSENQPLDKSQ